MCVCTPVYAYVCVYVRVCAHMHTHLWNKHRNTIHYIDTETLKEQTVQLNGKDGWEQTIVQSEKLPKTCDVAMLLSSIP